MAGGTTLQVGKCVAEVAEVISRDQQYHVNGDDNPDDCASRGIPAYYLVNRAMVGRDRVARKQQAA